MATDQGNLKEVAKLMTDIDLRRSMREARENSNATLLHNQVVWGQFLFRRNVVGKVINYHSLVVPPKMPTHCHVGRWGASYSPLFR